MKLEGKSQIKLAMMEQYKKCYLSPSYMMNQYAIIQHPTKGAIKFNLWDFQQKLVEDFNDHQWNIILKSRQIGISTLVAGYVLWFANFHPDKSILIIANKQQVAMNLIKKIRIMYDGLPEWMRQPLTTDNKQSIQFSNRSFIKASPATPDAGVSQALSLLVIDEAAVVRDNLMESIWAAASPTLASAGSRCIMLSTPRGRGSLFHRLWTEAQQGRNRFKTTKLYWWVHPWRDQAWRDNQTKTMGQKKAKRQYDCDFESSGDNVIKDQILQILKDSTITQPIQKMMSDMFWMWKYPEAQKDYIISCDVARGDGSDYSAFHVLCIQDNQQVGQFKGQIGTREYANFIVRIARMFNNAFVIVQNASIGWAVLQEIVNLDYKNLYYHKKDFKYIDSDLHSKQRQTKKTEKQRDILGFTTSSRTRPLIIQKMILILENNQFIIHSNRTLNELWTFAWINGKPQAMDKYNDDLIMSLAIGLWVRYTSYVVKIEGQRLAKQRLAAISSGLDRQKQNQKKLNTGFFSAGAIRSRNYYDTNIVTVGNQQIDVYREFIGVKE